MNSVPSKDLYKLLKESLSDTEIEIRKSSQDVNSLSKEPQNCPPKAFAALKIKEEMKIDLCKKVSSPFSNSRSRNKIQTIDEVPEHSSNSSRATSSSKSHKVDLNEEIESIMQEQKAKIRPISRKPNVSMRDEVKLLHMSSHQSISSFEDSEFEDRTKKVTQKDSSTMYDPPKLMISRATQFEAGDWPELDNWSQPAKNFICNRSTGKLYDSCQDLISISSLQSNKSKSCFGCVWKPITTFCRRKQK